MKFAKVPMIVALLLLGAQWALSQEPPEEGADGGELTMTLIHDPQAHLPEAVTKYIELPASASESGRLNSADGLSTADENRKRRQAGQDIAAEARERGQDFGQDMAEAAREIRENVTRGGGQENRPDPPAPPNNLPGPPNPPGTPNPPGPPGS